VNSCVAAASTHKFTTIKLVIEGDEVDEKKNLENVQPVSHSRQ